MSDSDTESGIWVSGARGFIGRVLLEKFADRGQFVLPVTYGESKPGPVASPQTGAVVGIGDKGAFREALDRNGVPRVMVHLGWAGMTDPGSDVHLTRNLEFGSWLFEQAFLAGVETILFAGTINEYGGREGCLEEEHLPQGRLTPYARAKIALAETGFHRAAAYGRRFVHVRLGYIFGAGQRSGSLLNKLVDCRRNGRAAELGPCEHYRDYLHVDAAAEGISQLSELNRSALVNLGSGGAIRLDEFVRKFWQALEGDGADLKFAAHPAREGEPDQPHAWMDISRIQDLTSWRPGAALDDAIRSTAHQMRAKAIEA